MNLSFWKSAITGLTVCLTLASFDASAYGQCGQLVSPSYRIHYRTVNEERTVYRPTYETIYEEQTVTSQRPVYETETRVRRYTVAKPVNETSTQISRYTVRKQVLDTETRTQERLVRRPVTEQVMQTRSHVVYDPVTTMETQCVDEGGYVDNYVLTPGVSRNRLQWLQGGYAQDPATGTMVYQRWVPLGPDRTAGDIPSAAAVRSKHRCERSSAHNLPATRRQRTDSRQCDAIRRRSSSRTNSSSGLQVC